MNRNILRFGRDEPLPERVPLRAGPISLIYQAGDLRYLKLGDRELIRRIYAAVRDRDWGTVPGVLSEVKVDAREDSFRISFVCEHRQTNPIADTSLERIGTGDGSSKAPLAAGPGGGSGGLIHFVWRGEIVGDSDGTIQFTFDGEARSTFLKNRVGFCVLHPIRECAGGPCRVEHTDGSTARSCFPKLVAAEQPMKDLHDLRALAHEIAPGVWVEVRFEGDAFEVEDQRNWIDASYKTFCTPLNFPFPVEIKAGTRVRQSVIVRLLDDPGRSGGEAALPRPERETRSAESRQNLMRLAAATDVQRGAVEIKLAPRVRRLPTVGLGSPSHDHVCMESEATSLATLRSAHLRVDLSVGQPNWQGALWLSAGPADADASLELAFHFPNVSPMAMKEVAHELERRRAQLVRILVFQEGAETTPERLMKLARKQLTHLDVPIGGGTNADFYQLNQSRPPVGWCDFICWSMNPQVHAFDNASLAETPSAIPAQVESAREYFPGKPLVVSPVTLKPRFNPVATGKQSGPAAGGLPPQVDPRQMSLFGAGWTLAVIKHLAETGVDSVTLYETTGWRGVMETEAGSPLPDKFRSIPGAVFPLYHVLADVGEFAGGEVVACNSSDSLAVEGMVLRKGGRLAVLLANMTDQPQVARVTGVRSPLSARLFDETNVIEAMTQPKKFRERPGDAAKTIAGTVEVELRPYGLARLFS